METQSFKEDRAAVQVEALRLTFSPAKCQAGHVSSTVVISSSGCTGSELGNGSLGRNPGDD